MLAKALRQLRMHRLTRRIRQQAGSYSDCGVSVNSVMSHLTLSRASALLQSAGLALLALGCHAQHLFNRRQPRRDLLCAGQAQAAHAVLEALTAQRRQVEVRRDQ